MNPRNGPETESWRKAKLEAVSKKQQQRCSVPMSIACESPYGGPNVVGPGINVAVPVVVPGVVDGELLLWPPPWAAARTPPAPAPTASVIHSSFFEDRASGGEALICRMAAVPI